MWHFHLQNHQITRLNKSDKSLLTWNELSTVRPLDRASTLEDFGFVNVTWCWKIPEFVRNLCSKSKQWRYIEIFGPMKTKHQLFVENINNARLCKKQIPTGNLGQNRNLWKTIHLAIPPWNPWNGFRYGTQAVMKLDGPEDPVNFMGGVEKTRGISRL